MAFLTGTDFFHKISIFASMLYSHSNLTTEHFNRFIHSLCKARLLTTKKVADSDGHIFAIYILLTIMTLSFISWKQTDTQGI